MQLRDRRSLGLQVPHDGKTWIHVVILGGLIAAMCSSATEAKERRVVPIWPAEAPGETGQLPPEADTTTADSRNVAGRRVTRLGNVSRPTLEFFRPAPEDNTGTAVVICPGGGYHILAYDLEGTEVAEWLQSVGVTGIVLKYRVPARDPEKRWEAAVQDAQRAVSVIREHAAEIDIDPKRVGILGFSAGANAAALTSLLGERQYVPVDNADRQPHRPDFAVLIYGAYLADQKKNQLVAEATVDAQTPPVFMVHAFDDGVSIENSLLLYLAMKRANRPAELHAYASGGHGFGMRPTEQPCTRWPEHCERWMDSHGWLERPTE